MIFVIIVLLLIAINAYFSAVEIALVSVKKFRIQEQADNGNKRAKQILELLKNPDEYLSSIQVGITLVSIIEGLYGGEILQEYLGPIFLQWGLPDWMAHVLSPILGVGIITYATIILGELLPKSIALLFPQKVALRTIPSFRIFNLISYPFVKFLTWSTHLLLQLFNVKGSENQKLTDTDLKGILSLAYRQGTIEKNEWLFHQNIFVFYDLTVESMMTPLEKVVLLKETMDVETVETILKESEHNYFPVIREDNTVAGYISARAFFVGKSKSWKEIIQVGCLVTRNQNAPDLLEAFKRNKNNFGIVVKLNGELEGIVTLHDIGEKLIGKFS